MEKSTHKCWGNKFEVTKSLDFIFEIIQFHKICHQMKKKPHRLLLILSSDRIINEKCVICIKKSLVLKFNLSKEIYSVH
jgi:hypothetical protein